MPPLYLAHLSPGARSLPRPALALSRVSLCLPSLLQRLPSEGGGGGGGGGLPNARSSERGGSGRGSALPSTRSGERGGSGFPTCVPLVLFTRITWAMFLSA